MKPVLCIVGMHRSRTSLIARALNLAGVRLGASEKLHLPQPSNPTGFWEYTAIVECHDAILAEFGRTWDTTLPLPTDWHRSAAIDRHRETLLRIVTEETSADGLWAWKDPRTCLLLPLWLDILEEAELAPHFVLCSRHPIAVARSLEARDGFEIIHGLGLWLHYMVATAEVLRRHPHVVARERDFLEDPELASRSVLKTLGLDARPPETESPDGFATLVRRDLVHWTDDDQFTTKMPRLCEDLWQIMRGLENQRDGLAEGDGVGGAGGSTVEAIVSEFREFASLFAHDAETARSNRVNTLRVLEDLQLHHAKTQATSEEYAIDLQAAIARKDKDLVAAFEALSDMEHKLKALTMTEPGTNQ